MDPSMDTETIPTDPDIIGDMDSVESCRSHENADMLGISNKDE